MGRSCLPGRRRGRAGVKSGFKFQKQRMLVMSWAQASPAVNLATLSTRRH
jgi:hypothetical protein